MKRLALAAVLAIGLAAAAWADFQDGLAAYERSDYATALREWRPLAEQGYAEAQFRLGVMYDQGLGVPQDCEKAIVWYFAAARAGHLGAQNNLGGMFYFGRCFQQDYAFAVEWYRKAAEQGSAAAQNNLGSMYRLGKGVPQDYVLAHMWFNLAAAKGSEIARMQRESITRKMTPAQIAEAQRLAREWTPKVK